MQLPRAYKLPRFESAMLRPAAGRPLLFRVPRLPLLLPSAPPRNLSHSAILGSSVPGRLPAHPTALRQTRDHLRTRHNTPTATSSFVRTMAAVANAAAAAPLPPLNFDLTPDQIREKTKDLIRRSKEIQDGVAALPEGQRTFESVIRTLGELENTFGTEHANYYFPQYVHADKEVRQASQEAEQELKQFEIESSMRLDLFQAVSSASKHASSQNLAEEDKRLVDRLLLDFRRNGLALPEKQREELKTLRKREADLGIKFSANMNEDTTSLTFTKEELIGMPDDWLSGLKKDDKDNYIVTMKYPDLIPVQKLCNNPTTRRRMALANDRKCKDNVKLLEDTLKIRAEAAALLQYETHAAFELETKMAKKPEAVRTFLDDLRSKLKVLAERELKVLEKIKQDEKERFGIAEGEKDDGKVKSYDSNFLTRILLEREYKVDHEAIKQYFSLEKVTNGMLEIYERVLGCKFVEVTKDKKKVWHPDVRMFEVWNSDSSGKFIGYFYLDLHPRDGKYTHAACFGLVPGYDVRKEDGCVQRQYPSAAMVANFSKPTADAPSLLKHNEFETYFHELGHVMHSLLSETKWSRFHGTAVERDFVEAPSQMLENWCWDPEVLHNISSHYARPDEKLSKEQIESLIRSRNVNAGLNNLRQIFFGTFDMIVHSAKATDLAIDTTELWATLREEITLIAGLPDTFPAASFGHIMGGYDAGYYGYLWSQVFSADMFYSRFKKEGVNSPVVGGDYRKYILKPGGSKDGDILLRGFLGRDPTPDAFLRSIGLQQ